MSYQTRLTIRDSPAKLTEIATAPEVPPMIAGAHVLLYSENPDADRAFFRDVLGFPAVDAGGGWRSSHSLPRK